jgi:hypothetical protein
MQYSATHITSSLLGRSTDTCILKPQSVFFLYSKKGKVVPVLQKLSTTP